MRADGTVGVVHVPKTGGAAIRAAFGAIAEWYTGPCYHDSSLIDGVDVSSLPPATGSQFATPSSMRRICDSHRLVMGHYAAYFLVEAGCQQLATQLREPRARLLSLYRYWRALPEGAVDDWGPWGDVALRSASLPLESFLTSTGAWTASDNGIARQLLGRPVTGAAPHPRGALRQVLAGEGYRWLRDRLSIVEWSSDSQRFADRVCTAMGVEPITVARVNEATDIDGVQTIDANGRALMEQLTSIDRALIDQMMEDGLMRSRSADDLDEEFEATAARLGFVIS